MMPSKEHGKEVHMQAEHDIITHDEETPTSDCMTTIHPFQSSECQNYLTTVMKQIARVKVASTYADYHV